MTGDEQHSTEWRTGDCFRCASTGVPTARIEEIRTPLGQVYDVRACPGCVARMEGERRRVESRRTRYHLGSAAVRILA